MRPIGRSFYLLYFGKCSKLGRCSGKEIAAIATEYMLPRPSKQFLRVTDISHNKGKLARDN